MNRVIKNILILISLCLPVISSARPTIKLEFKRLFSSKYMEFTNDRMVVVKAKISGLEKMKKYSVGLTYGFASEENKFKTLNKRSDGKGEINLERMISLYKFYKKNEGSAKIFTLQTWIQGQKLVAPVLAKTWKDLLVLPKGGDTIYKLTSGPLCMWQGNSQIESEPIYNDAVIPLFIGRREIYEASKGILLSAGGEAGAVMPDIPSGTIPTTPTTPTAPLGPSSFNPLSSSIFIGATYSSKLETKEYLELVQSWTLHAGQAAYRYRRNTFTRYKTTAYNEFGGVYVASEVGYLDVGHESQNLSIVPISFLGQYEKILQYIDENSPRLNSCDDRSLTSDNYNSFIVPNNSLKILFNKTGVIQ